MCHTGYMKARGLLWDLLLSFHPVGPGDRTLVAKRGRKHLLPTKPSCWSMKVLFYYIHFASQSTLQSLRAQTCIYFILCTLKFL